MPETLSDNVSQSRFELGVNGARGFIAYRRSGKTSATNLRVEG